MSLKGQSHLQHQLQGEQTLQAATAMHTSSSSGSSNGNLDQASAIAAQPPSVYAHLPPYSAASVSNYLSLPLSSYGHHQSSSPPHLQPQPPVSQLSPSLDALASVHSYGVFASSELSAAKSVAPPTLQQQAPQQHTSAFVPPRFKRCSPESATAAQVAAAAAAAVAAAAASTVPSASSSCLLPSKRSGSPLTAASFFRPVPSAGDLDTDLKRVIEKEKTMPMKKRKMTPTGTPVNMECTGSPITVPGSCHTPPSSSAAGVLKYSHNVRTYSEC